MPELAEAAIELALLGQAEAFATAQSLTLVAPNGKGAVPPNALPTAQWLRANVLPAPTMTTGIAFSSYNQHYGILQIDVMQGLGGGTAAMKRLVGAIASFFPMGTVLANNGFDINIISHSRNQVVAAGPLLLDGTFMMIPVSIPYRCFDRPA